MFFHAHPDDEALYTAGTMARLAAEGHRVVLVVATSGDRGLTAPEYTADALEPGLSLGDLRLAELNASARALGVDRVEYLGYADSGLDSPVDVENAFSRVEIERPATELAAILDAEGAALMTTYDPNGGYGHPDHVQAHKVAYRAAELAASQPTVLEATIDADRLRAGLRLLARLADLTRSSRLLGDLDVSAAERWYVPGTDITHRVDVTRYLDQKRASLAAHTTQTTGGDTIRTISGLLRLPNLLFRLVLGTEWFVRRDIPSGARLRHPLAG